jgi:aminoglycoside 2'-N-acetyltransferase I
VHGPEAEASPGIPAGINLSVVPAKQLGDVERSEVIELCSEAYETDFSEYLAWLKKVTHVLARDEDGRLVSHACWVTRWLQVESNEPMRTAYVEAVATARSARNRGLASAIMRKLQDAVGDYDIAALSPAVEGIYARLGWEKWRGPLFARRDGVIEASPDDEGVMIFRLPRTPPLDLGKPLSIEWRPGGEIW